MSAKEFFSGAEADPRDDCRTTVTPTGNWRGVEAMSDAMANGS